MFHSFMKVPLVIVSIHTFVGCLCLLQFGGMASDIKSNLQGNMDSCGRDALINALCVGMLGLRNEHHFAQSLHLDSLNDAKRAMTKANPPCRGRSSVGRKLYVLQDGMFKGRTGGSGNREVEEGYQPMGDDDSDILDAIEDPSPLVQTGTAELQVTATMCRHLPIN